MNVQEVIDELMKVEDKTRPVRVYMKSGGISGIVDVSSIDPNEDENLGTSVYIDAIEKEKSDVN